MDFFDEQKLITYSAMLPYADKESFFLLSEELFLWAQGKIYSKNMAERSDLKTGEVLNSILYSLKFSLKDKTLKYAVKKESLEIRKTWHTWKKRCIKYNGCRLISDNYQKLRDVQNLITEVVPKIEEPPINIIPIGKISELEELSITINILLSLFKTETEDGTEGERQ